MIRIGRDGVQPDCGRALRGDKDAAKLSSASERRDGIGMSGSLLGKHVSWLRISDLATADVR
jgi:hypothetical protein